MADKNPERYPNIGKGWAKEDVDVLIDMAEKRVPLVDIQTALGRTAGGIRSRLRAIQHDLYKKGGAAIEDIENRIGSDFYELYGLRESLDAWNEKDDAMLLQHIAKKHCIEEIARILQRPSNVVYFNRTRLAARYHNEDGDDAEDIQALLGMTAAEVESAFTLYPAKTPKVAVAKRERERKRNKEVVTTTVVPLTEIIHKEPTMSELMVVLKDIQTKLQYILTRIE